MQSQQLLERVSLEALRGGLGAVPGFRLGGAHGGLKKRKSDVALIVADAPCAVAACITENDVKAAPLIVSAQHLEASNGRAVALVCNSGCANACTGERGLADARATAGLVAGVLDCAPREVIVASTGVIGVPLSMEAMRRGIGRAAARLAPGVGAAREAAEAIMTTDRVSKLAAYAFCAGERRFVVGGIAKGSGMIAPNLATMLAFIGTDAPVGGDALQRALFSACDGTFNMISVDGDMSTNDAVYAFAAPHADASHVPEGFTAALTLVCRDLAIAVARDGEGATKLLQVTVRGACADTQARALARAIVNSNLVKAALFGEDPNWGRIVAAAGAAKAGFPATGWCIALNGSKWIRDGEELIAQEIAHRKLAEHDIQIDLALGLGTCDATAWGCDLSGDYVRINAHYRS